MHFLCPFCPSRCSREADSHDLQSRREKSRMRARIPSFIVSFSYSVIEKEKKRREWERTFCRTSLMSPFIANVWHCARQDRITILSLFIKCPLNLQNSTQSYNAETKEDLQVSRFFHLRQDYI